MARTGHLRASDADRDQVAERLRTAAAEGRIGFDELEERLTATLAARTYGELEAMVADLPSSPPARRHAWLPASPLVRVAIVLAIAVPAIMAAIVAVTAFLSAWLVWALVGWYVFGNHRHGPYPRRYGASRAHWHARPGPGRGPWT
jgi:hypothetical protein